jgi:hypothetical protein
MKLKIAKERIVGMIAANPKVVTFSFGMALIAVVSTAIGILEPHYAAGTIDTGSGGGASPIIKDLK